MLNYLLLPSRFTCPIFRAFILLIFLSISSSHTLATPRIMALGDSITNGGNNYVSYRYPLYYDLVGSGYNVNFVGTQNSIFSSIPIAALYPNYSTTFDRDHEGYWGQRTDQILNNVINNVMPFNQPDVVLIHLGTNDLGQSGAAGVTNAAANLTQIIQTIRSYRPNVRILLAQVIPIGPGTSYFTYASQVAVLNTEIVNIAATTTTTQSPVIVVDMNTGFDLATFLQSDGLHPNDAGEAFMSARWSAALQPVLDNIGNGFPVNPPPAPTAAELDFEIPVLADGSLSAGPGIVGGWQFDITSPGNFAGIYNPPVSTYASASGDNPPSGAIGSNVAYLVNMENGESASLQRVIGLLEANRRYEITVAVGQRLATSPFGGANFGGYRLELVVNSTVIGSIADAVTPAQGTFQDSTLILDSNSVAPSNIGELLTLRMSINSTAADTHVDLDNVRINNLLIGDINTDGIVDSRDVGIMMNSWGSSGGPADLNNDANVGTPDLELQLQAIPP